MALNVINKIITVNNAQNRLTAWQQLGNFQKKIKKL